MVPEVSSTTSRPLCVGARERPLHNREKESERASERERARERERERERESEREKQTASERVEGRGREGGWDRGREGERVRGVASPARGHPPQDPTVGLSKALRWS